ncbi:MAG TPA: Crp/Fnr family transcriptional regulator [Thermoanaerobaculia bacterium]
MALPTRENLILAAIPPAERYRIVRQMEPVDLPPDTILSEANQPVEHVYFLTSGTGGILATMSDGRAVQTACIGAEGFIGLSVMLGVDQMPMTAVQQIAGSGLRMRAAAFADEVRTETAFRERLHRFAGLLLMQVTQNAACNRLHDAPARCARWLLLSSDRLGRHELPLTHESIGQMLGASRPAASTPVRALETDGIIEQSRGWITITNRAELEARACECYSVLRQEWREYLDSLSLGR